MFRCDVSGLTLDPYKLCPGFNSLSRYIQVPFCGRLPQDCDISTSFREAAPSLKLSISEGKEATHILDFSALLFRLKLGFILWKDSTLARVCIALPQCFWSPFSYDPTAPMGHSCPCTITRDVLNPAFVAGVF